MQGVLLSKVCYVWRYRAWQRSMSYENALPGRRASLYTWGSVGQGGGLDAFEHRSATDVEALLTPRSLVGGGAPDVLGRLPADVALDMLALIESRHQSGTEAVMVALKREASSAGTYPAMGKALQLLHRTAGLTLHMSHALPLQPAPCPAIDPHDADRLDLLSFAQLACRPSGLAYRALRRDEVMVAHDGEVRIAGASLKAKSPHSQVSAAESVALGSRLERDAFLHLTIDPAIAVFCAKHGHRSASCSTGSPLLARHRS